MAIYADLHIHSNCSDGELTPEAVVDIALKNNLGAIAITDHDSLSGIERAITHSKGKIQIIPAVELSCEVNGKDLHILGHFLDYKDETLNTKLKKFQKTRETRGERIVEKLREIENIDLDYEEIKRKADGGSIGRPHIAKELIEKKIVSTKNEAFDLYLGDHTQTFVPKYKITPEEGIKLIRDAGGIASWAHPGSNECDELLEEFIRYGLQGLEVYHPSHDHPTKDHYYTLARRHDLFIVGGSDFHSPRGVIEIGSFGLTQKHFEKMISRVGQSSFSKK